MNIEKKQYKKVTNIAKIVQYKFEQSSNNFTKVITYYILKYYTIYYLWTKGTDDDGQMMIICVCVFF